MADFGKETVKCSWLPDTFVLFSSRASEVTFRHQIALKASQSI